MESRPHPPQRLVEKGAFARPGLRSGHRGDGRGHHRCHEQRARAVGDGDHLGRQGRFHRRARRADRVCSRHHRRERVGPSQNNTWRGELDRGAGRDRGLNADNPVFIEIGINPGDLAGFGVKVLAGQPYAPTATNEVMLGWRAVSNLGLHVGDRFYAMQRWNTVTGIFSTGNSFGDAGAMFPLPAIQGYNRVAGLVTLAFVKVVPGSCRLRSPNTSSTRCPSSPPSGPPPSSAAPTRDSSISRRPLTAVPSSRSSSGRSSSATRCC